MSSSQLYKQNQWPRLPEATMENVVVSCASSWGKLGWHSLGFDSDCSPSSWKIRAFVLNLVMDVVFNFFVPCLGEDEMIGLRKVSLSWWIICVFSATFLDFSWQRIKSWSSATEIPRTKTENPVPRKRGLRFSHWDSTAEISHGYLDTQSRQILSVVFGRV